MKTVTEMQLLIQDAYAKLDELSRNLSEYSLAQKETFIQFDRLLSLGKRYPITRHPLTNTEGIVIRKYLTLLISLINLATVHAENGWLLIQRIACGVGLNIELEELAADAAILSDQQLDEFTNLLSQNSLSQNFLFDCMLLYISCGSENREMIAYISLLFELLQFDKTQISELSTLAKIIATQDEDAYTDFRSEKKSFDVDDFNGYAAFWKNGMLLNEACICIFGDMYHPYHRLKGINENAPIYVFGVTFTHPVKLENYRYIEFNNCNFVNINAQETNPAIHFSKIDTLTVNSCHFSNLSSHVHTIEFIDNREVILHNCNFANIKSTSPKLALPESDFGGFFRSISSLNTVLEHQRTWHSFNANNSKFRVTNSTAKGCTNVEAIPSLRKID